MKVIYNFILVIIVLLLGTGVYLYNGMYNFAATSPHNKITKMIIHESMEISVKKHSKNIDVPKLDEEKMINEGFVQYDTMCAMCHGAPGMQESVLYQGLYPKPPKLYEDHEEWKDEELFWIVKNGVKMTGMPAYGPTHSDDELYAIVAFLKILPELSAEEYEELIEINEKLQLEHSHDHGNEKTEQDNLKSGDARKGNIHLHKDGSEHIH